MSSKMPSEIALPAHLGTQSANFGSLPARAERQCGSRGSREQGVQEGGCNELFETWLQFQ